MVERQPILADRSYSIILETFERRLRLGELRVGDKLPSERELAARHGISRPSVREGLRVLNALGLIRSSTGSGRSRARLSFLSRRMRSAGRCACTLRPVACR